MGPSPRKGESWRCFQPHPPQAWSTTHLWLVPRLPLYGHRFTELAVQYGPLQELLELRSDQAVSVVLPFGLSAAWCLLLVSGSWIELLDDDAVHNPRWLAVLTRWSVPPILAEAGFR